MADPLLRFLKDLSGLERLRARMRHIENPDAGPLMISWMKIIDDDNRRGVLAGTDKDGRLMYPVKYRPVGRPKKLTIFQRNTANPHARRGDFAGLGLFASGVHNNLSPAEYRRLAGPPLAPRKGFSRVITNLRTKYGRVSARVWRAIGYWDEVVSKEGVPFLIAHFEGLRTGRKGATKLPKRDLRGVRPEGVHRARVAARGWMLDAIRSQPPTTGTTGGSPGG